MISMTLALLTWLIDATIKGSVVIAIVALLQLAIGPRLGARWRHALWLIVLVRLALPAAPPSSWSIFNVVDFGKRLTHVEVRHLTRPVAHSEIAAAKIPPEVRFVTPSSFLRYSSIVLSIWLAGVGLLALRAVVSSMRMHRAVRRAYRRCEAVDAGLVSLVAESAAQLRISKSVRVLESNLVQTPALHGFFEPTLLLPSGLAASFDRDELRHIVLHELWHLRRRDVAVNWVLSAIQALHWFNPFVWFAMARIREERELACDELALSCLEEEERIGYGMTILKLLERFRAPAPVPALVGIINQKQQIKRRLTMIASFRNRTRFSILFLGAAAFVGAVAMTDATAGEKRVMRRIHGDATTAKLHQRVSINLTNATFGELLSAVSNSAGVAVTQSPDIATTRAQQARFTITAQNVPAHLVLMEALSPFELAPMPEGDGIVISKGEGCMHMRHAIPGEHASHEGELPAGSTKSFEKRIIVKGDAELPMKVEIDEEAVPGEGKSEKRVFIHKIGDGGGDCRLSADGKLHREMTLELNENGVASEGKLVLDITAPATTN